MEEKYNGCLGLGHTSQDWELSAEELYKLPKLFPQNDKRFYYDQSGTSDCTIYSALGAISDLWDYEFSQKEIDEVNEMSYKRGRTRGEGWYVQDAVKLACDYWNEKNPDKTVAYYYITKHETEKIRKILELGYNICTGFRGNGTYKKDREDNGQIDNKERGEPTYGHAINIIKTDKWKKAVKDNYDGRETNVYGLIPELKDMKNWNYGAYLIIKKDEEMIEERKRLTKFKEKAEQMVTLNSELWELTNSEELKDALHKENELLRKSLEYIYTNLK